MVGTTGLDLPSLVEIPPTSDVEDDPNVDDKLEAVGAASEIILA